MYQKGLFLILIVASLVFLSSSVSANFVCGAVDIDEDIELSPAWLSVDVHYVDDPEHITSCQVSPEGNRYCCDPQAIEEVGWQIGKEVSARVFDSSAGLFSEPQTVSISGEGFDVFETLTVREAIILERRVPQVRINARELILNFSADPYFDTLSYSVNHSGNFEEVLLCESCSNAYIALNVSEYGSYDISLIVENDQERMTKQLDFINLAYLHADWQLECDGCFQRHRELWYAPSDTVVNVSVFLNASHPLDNRLYEFFHNDWEYLGGASGVEGIWEDYSRAFWDVEGTTGVFRYSALSPTQFFFPRGYTFGTILEDEGIDKREVRVLSFFRFFRFSFFNEDLEDTAVDYSQFTNVLQTSPRQPIVLFTKHRYLSQVAVFPNKPLRDVGAFVDLNPRITKRGAAANFAIHTTLAKEDIDGFLLEFLLEDALVEDETFVLYRYDPLEDEWNAVLYELEKSSSKPGFYTLFIEKGGNYALELE